MKTIGQLIFLLLLLVLQGCTMYTIERTMTDGSTVKVDIKSNRSFEQPNVHYERKGDDAVFDFGAAAATDSTSALINALLSGAVQIVTPPRPVPLDPSLQ